MTSDSLITPDFSSLGPRQYHWKRDWPKMREVFREGVASEETKIAHSFDPLDALGLDAVRILGSLFPAAEMQILAKHDCAHLRDSIQVSIPYFHLSEDEDDAWKMVDFLHLDLPFKILLPSSANHGLVASCTCNLPPFYGIREATWKTLDEERRAFVTATAEDKLRRALPDSWNPFFMAVAKHRQRLRASQRLMGQLAKPSAQCTFAHKTWQDIGESIYMVGVGLGLAPPEAG